MDIKVNFDLSGIAEEMNATVDLVRRKVALEIWGELIATTPVDTGRARAGWNMGTSHENSAPASIQKPSEWKSGGTAYYPTPSTPVPPSNAPVIVIYNNVDYVMYLNEGSSSQAPEMFVEKAVQKAADGFK